MDEWIWEGAKLDYTIDFKMIFLVQRIDDESGDCRQQKSCVSPLSGGHSSSPIRAF